MSLSTPYRQHNYMGEYAGAGATGDALALAFIRAQLWDSTANGAGDPKVGVFYYNSTDAQFRVYTSGGWVALSSSTPTLSAVLGSGNTTGATHIVVSDGSALDLTADGGSGGAEITVNSGAEINVLSGGEVNFADGGILTIADITHTTFTGTPTAGTHAVNKAYVDSVATGLDPKASVRLATAAALESYTPAGSGVGKTLTRVGNGALTVDGIAAAVTNRILVKSEAASHADHGIYTVTAAGSGGAPWVLTRATDCDEAAEYTAGVFCFVTEGNTLADTAWVVTTNDSIVVDTTAVAWGQFAGPGSYTAGDGIDIVTQSISVDLASGGGLKIVTGEIAVEPNDFVGTGLQDDGSDNITLKLYATLVTTGGSASANNNPIYLDSTNGINIKVDNSTIGIKAADYSLYIPNGGVTATQLNASVAGAGISGGGGTALALDVHDATDGTGATLTTSDEIAFADADAANVTKRATLSQLVTLMNSSLNLADLSENADGSIDIAGGGDTYDGSAARTVGVRRANGTTDALGGIKADGTKGLYTTSRSGAYETPVGNVTGVLGDIYVSNTTGIVYVHYTTTSNNTDWVVL